MDRPEQFLGVPTDRFGAARELGGLRLLTLPGAATDFRWQSMSPSGKISKDPRGGEVRGHHAHETAISKAITKAVRRSGIRKRATSHSWWDGFTRHLSEAGPDTRTVRELLGHEDVSTTMIHPHVLNQGGQGVRGPLDAG